jgi:hypothetical protein
MASRGSEGEERRSKSRLSRSLSATRNFFKNRDNLDKSEDEEDIREHPLTPDIEISVHSSKVILNILRAIQILTPPLKKIV